MKYTLTYTLEITEIMDDEEVNEERLVAGKEKLNEYGKFVEELMDADDVLCTNYKVFVHDEEDI